MKLGTKEKTDMVEIEAGKFYKTESGHVVGPMQKKCGATKEDGVFGLPK